MNRIIKELRDTRRATGLNQDMLAAKAGLSRMTVQRVEAETIDPRLSTLQVMARTLGMEIMLVPAVLRGDLEEFVRSGGRFLGQAAGVAAPKSIIDTLAPPPPARPDPDTKK